MTAGDVYRALWRHKLLILVLTAACVAATWYVTSRETRIYKASTLVRVQQRGAVNSFASLDASIAVAQTYAEIINSGALNSRVRSAVSWLAPRLVAGAKLSAEPVADLGLIWISARGEQPVGVAAIANAAPNALRSATRQYGTPGDVVITVKRATQPGTAVSPDTTLNVVLALVFGLMFNGGLALVFEVLRDRLPEPDELEASLGYPVLATIPTLRLKPITALGEERTDVGAFERERAHLTRSGTSSQEGESQK